MKILHITSQYPGKTGSGTYLQAMIKEANRKGHVQGLLGASQEGMEYQNPILDYIDMVEFNSEEIPFPIMGMSDKMPYNSSVFKDMTSGDINIWESEFSARLIKALEEFRPDVILSNHLWLASSKAVEISRDIPVYGICHGTDIRQFHKVPLLGQRTVKGINNLKGIFALTVDQKGTIERLYGVSGEKIKVVGGGYDEEIFHFEKGKLPEDKIRIVYAGKISYAKGLLPLLDAYEGLSVDKPLELVMAGSGDGSEKEEIVERGSSLEVKFTGALSQGQLADLFRSSHIFVLPSYYEGLPLVIMEALACGLRIVTTDIPGLKGYIGEDLATSGIVQFVDLPRMIDVDTPLKEDYNNFVMDLKKTLEHQIRNANDGYNKFAPFKEEIEKLSWEGVFNRIYDFF